MECEIEYTDEFGNWWDEELSEDEQDSVNVYVNLLKARGVKLGFPYSSSIESSKHSHMRELRVQYSGKPYRVLYAFDPRRTAILLIGGCKVGNDRWYDEFVPIADKIYDKHVKNIRKLINK